MKPKELRQIPPSHPSFLVLYDALERLEEAATLLVEDPNTCGTDASLSASSLYDQLWSLIMTDDPRGLRH